MRNDGLGDLGFKVVPVLELKRDRAEEHHIKLDRSVKI